MTRILLWQQSQEAVTTREVAEADAKDVAGTAQGVAKDPEAAARNAVK